MKLLFLILSSTYGCWKSFSPGYVCVQGKTECIQQPQKNGNLLCSTTHLNLAEAEYFCQIHEDQCDGIISNGKRWEAVRNASDDEKCETSLNINELVFTEYIRDI